MAVLKEGSAAAQAIAGVPVVLALVVIRRKVSR